MKNMKKFFTFLLTLVMVMGMTLSASAHTISITKGNGTGETTNHEYTVYQLFVGTLAEDGKTLLDMKYGSAGLGEEGTFVPAEVFNKIKKQDDAEAYAKEIMATKTLTEYDKLNADNEWTLTEVPSGYYLIVDNTEKEIGTGDTYSKYIVKVVGDLAMNPKSEKVIPVKKAYNDAAQLTAVNEAGLGAVVSYDLSATIPVDAKDYDYYFFILGDNLSKGLTFNNDIVVTIGGEPAVEDTDYKVYRGEDGYTFEVALLDAKAHAGEEVKVNYSATVNADAVVTKPETNEFEVKYSNKPYENYKPLIDGNKPGKPVSDKLSVLGTTPKEVTETYTVEIDLTKRANSKTGALLEGAVFQLTSQDANQTVVKEHTYFELDENGEYYLLNNGTYTKKAPIADSYVEIGTGDETTEEGYLQDAEGNYYVPEDKTEYAGKTLYKLVEGTGSQYASTTNKYAEKTASETASVAAPVNMTFTTGADGVIRFEDLGTGTYVLHEVQAPEGYNLAPDVTIVITFDEETKKFTVEGATDDDDKVLTGGIYDVTVVDQSGSKLPETGGVGTTMFYVFGSVLVAAAGVLLITKKRMTAR